ncbi:MAG TPA: NUDIX hydrolase [Beijerinckiaceae bacterium]|jgi:8-oxo-dGTP pyrophosphatase MutT (NUDIX family)
MDGADNTSSATSSDPDGPEDILRQVAALPLRWIEGRCEVLLVTSRETRRWIIPKGWPMAALKDRKAAALEAKQEAGVVGRVGRAPIGTFLYWKRRERHFDLVRVDVYPLAVERHLSRWKEKGQRDLRWFGLDEAARLVGEPGLATLVAGLADVNLTSILATAPTAETTPKSKSKAKTKGRKAGRTA